MFALSRIERGGVLGEQIIMAHRYVVTEFLTPSELKELKKIVDSTIRAMRELGLTTEESVNERNRALAEESMRTPPVKREPKLKKRDDLYVIFDADANAYKVGRSINPESRLRAMSVASSHSLRLSMEYVDYGDFEGKVHDSLTAAGLHIRGEWFKNDSRVFYIIESICDPCTKVYY